MYRRGFVVAIDTAAARVRVQFPDRDGLVSWWLDVVAPRAGTDRAYWLPGIGEQVACLLDAGGESGCVLGSVYQAAHPPPADDPDIARVTFGDGARFTYDRAASVWHVEVPGDVVIESAATVRITGAVRIEGDLQVTGDAVAGTGSGDGVSLTTHTHGGVRTGNGRTGGPG